MKKVTYRKLQIPWDISRTTVWKVFSGHEGVSDSLRTKVIAKAQELGYAIPEDFQYPSSAEGTTPVNIAVAVCRPETSTFLDDHHPPDCKSIFNTQCQSRLHVSSDFGG